MTSPPPKLVLLVYRVCYWLLPQRRESSAFSDVDKILDNEEKELLKTKKDNRKRYKLEEPWIMGAAESQKKDREIFGDSQQDYKNNCAAWRKHLSFVKAEQTPEIREALHHRILYLKENEEEEVLSNLLPQLTIPFSLENRFISTI